MITIKTDERGQTRIYDTEGRDVTTDLKVLSANISIRPMREIVVQMELLGGHLEISADPRYTVGKYENIAGLILDDGTIITLPGKTKT